jgi:hypothetical protein
MPPPASGPAAILQRALEGAGSPGEADDADPVADQAAGLDDLTARRTQRTVRFVRTHRVLSAAAIIVLAFVVVGGATWLGSNPTPTSSNVAIRSGAVTSTTLPLSGHGKSSGNFGIQGTAGVPLSGGTGASTGASAGASPTIGGSTAPTPASTATGNGGTATATPPASAPTSASLPNNVGQSARIEQTGSLSLTVAKGAVAKTLSQLTTLVIFEGGFVANSQTQTGAVSVTGAPSGNITLQVPVANFSDLLSKAQALGKTNALTTKATDVTGQYTDLQARIAALQASRTQYLTILAKATSIGDVLAVQAQLDNIQSQLEQLQGQLQVLTGETDYSTVNVDVTQVTPKPHPQPATHPSGLSKAWHDSIHGFVTGVEGIIRLAGPVLFTLLLAAALLLGGRVLWRRYQRHNL